MTTIESGSTIQQRIDEEIAKAKAVLVKEKAEADAAQKEADRQKAEENAASEDVTAWEEIKSRLNSPTAPTPPTPTPVPPPTSKALTLLPPAFVDGLLTWKSDGGNGSPVEFKAIGISDWTDKPVRVGKLDKNFGPITIQARQSGKETAPLVYDLLKNEVVTTPPPTGDKPTSKPPVPPMPPGTNPVANLDISDAVNVEYFEQKPGQDQ